MARPIRIEFENAVYHVTARGNERRDIYRDDKDRIRFQETLEETVERFGVVIHAYCLIPNHVHLLVCLLGDTHIEAQCTSWKRFTATQINRHLGRRRRFWQEESFDHLVRSARQFEAIQRYIANNPRKARLRESQFHYWRRP